MRYRAAVIRVAVFFLAAALLLSDSPEVTGLDELRCSRPLSQGTAPMVIGNPGDAYDDNRLARGICSIHPVVSVEHPSITQASYVIQAEIHPFTSPRKIYELNAVFLI
jgi:hypothetical protein